MHFPSAKPLLFKQGIDIKLTEVRVEGSREDSRGQVFLSSIPLLLYSLFSSLSASLSLGRRFKRAVFSQVMWSTFVCSNLTKECLAFTRLCPRGAVKESGKKVVREEGKGEGKGKRMGNLKRGEKRRKGEGCGEDRERKREEEGMESARRRGVVSDFSHAVDKT